MCSEALYPNGESFVHIHLLDNHATLTSLDLSGDDTRRSAGLIVQLPRLPHLRKLKIPHTLMFQYLFTPILEPLGCSTDLPGCSADNAIPKLPMPRLETLHMTDVCPKRFCSDLDYFTQFESNARVDSRDQNKRLDRDQDPRVHTRGQHKREYSRVRDLIPTCGSSPPLLCMFRELILERFSIACEPLHALVRACPRYFPHFRLHCNNFNNLTSTVALSLP
jgi:hypothetical protein